MGANWEEYIDEVYRALEYNGEIIISESVERYDKIKNIIILKKFKIINEEYSQEKRWFYLNAIKN